MRSCASWVAVVIWFGEGAARRVEVNASNTPETAIETTTMKMIISTRLKPLCLMSIATVALPGLFISLGNGYFSGFDLNRYRARLSVFSQSDCRRTG